MNICKKIDLDIKLEIDMPKDMMDDKQKLKAMEDGLIKCISKGLYEEGVSFRIEKVKFKI